MDLLEEHIKDQISKLQNPNANIRYEACEYLRVAPSITPEAIEALEMALNDTNKSVAEAAHRALEIQAPTRIPTKTPEPIKVPEKEQYSFHQEKISMPNGSPNTPNYIFALEKRIMYLELEINKLESVIEKTKLIDRDIQNVEELVPESNLMSKNFFTRAFAVWGHYFVAQLLISLILGGIYLILIALGVMLFRT
jgi:hypothetical protein